MIVLAFLLLFPLVSVSGQSLPEWYIPLREAIYEQKLSADEIMPVYNNVSNRAKASLSGAAQYIMLSRCEYMMGRAYQYEEKKDQAASHFEEGIIWAQKALELQDSAEAWQMLAENISQSCAVRSVSYAMANGLKVERYSKNALTIDRRNAAAQIMIAARWVYAPSPFNNYRRGIEMMSAIPDESNMQKDDFFNVYIGIGYAYLQQKNSAQARQWLQKSLEVYPTNKYAQSLLAKL
ncbi:MAG: tetratricopeptide repeat protein [Treponema sp.]|nr:tetratricopeptide repeat protein [Treponema sp.]